MYYIMPNMNDFTHDTFLLPRENLEMESWVWK